MTAIPHISLTLSNRPENILIVRQTLSALAELVEIERVELNDISTAAAEACNNVVLHAYPDGEGPLEVEICLGSSALELVVRDRGLGMSLEQQEAGEASGGLGLRVIHTLAQRVKVDRSAGVEIRMEFPAPRAEWIADAASSGPRRFSLAAQAELGSTVAIEIEPPELARALIPNLLPALAAQAHFSVEGMRELALLSEGLLGVVAAKLTSAEVIGATATPGRGELMMRMGPVPWGSAGGLFAEAAKLAGSVLATQLLRSPSPVPAGSTELLVLRLEQL